MESNNKSKEIYIKNSTCCAETQNALPLPLPKSTWEYKITNNNNIYIYIKSGSSNLLLDKI